MHERKSRRAMRDRHPLIELATRVAVFLLWYFVLGAFLFMPPLVGTLWVAGIAALFLWRYAVRVPSRHALLEHATLRLRPIGAGLRWLLLGAPVVLVFAGAVSVVWLYFFDPASGADSAVDVLDAYMRRPLGWLPAGLLIVLVGPLIEEFVFRGWIQRPLERRWGPVVAITATAALFAAMHFEPIGVPVRFLLGIILGFAVYATRSIWAGVLLHAINNGVAVAGGFEGTAGQASPTTTRDVLFATAAAVLSGVLLVWMAGRLWSATRAADRSRAAADFRG